MQHGDQKAFWQDPFVTNASIRTADVECSNLSTLAMRVSTLSVRVVRAAVVAACSWAAFARLFASACAQSGAPGGKPDRKDILTRYEEQYLTYILDVQMHYFLVPLLSYLSPAPPYHL